MASRMVENLTTTFLDTMKHLYLDYPGIGEFSKEQIINNLPRKSNYLDCPPAFPKADCVRRIADIMRCARDRGYNMVRVGGYYKIVNIKEVLEKHHKRQGMSPPPFPTPAINKAIWGG
jgi:hypothetical protein